MGLLGRVVFLLMVLLLSLQAVVYEDAEDGTINRWRVIDNDPAGSEVNNLQIGENRVIHLLGDRTKNAFILGGKNTETQYKWHNQDNSKVLSWRMKFDERYYIYVYVETESGEVSRFRYSSSRDNELKRSDIRISLGKESDDGEWVNVTRNIEEDLQQFKPNDTIVAINGFMVVGTGMVDDISFGTSQNPEENQTPIADAGEDKTIALGDTVTLNGTGEDSDGNIVLYSWSYNDQGLYSSENSGIFSYTPSQKGVYTLTLSVKDNDGLENTDTMTLTVLEDDENLSSEFITQWRKSSGEDMGNAITVVGDEVTFNEKEFFIVGGKQTDTLHSWDNQSDKSLSWKMKFNTRYYLYVYIETDAGTLLKLRYSSSRDNELKRDEIRISLGTESDDGEWVEVDRHLNDDLHQFKADENILVVHGIALQTSSGGEVLESLMLYNSLEHDTIPPEITLLGESSVSIVEGEIYADAGAEAYDNKDGNITSKIIIDNPVDTSSVGTYTVRYNISDVAGNSAKEVTRSVRVRPLDTEKPLLTLIGDAELTIIQDDPYTDQGASASDNIDGDISSQIKTNNPVDSSVVGTYTITYDVQDSSDNKAVQISRVVHVVEGNDSVPPLIELLGQSTVDIQKGDSYIDEGATATDNRDGNLTENIILYNPVDTNSTGTYIITYDVNDSAGNMADQVIRTVNVKAVANEESSYYVSTNGNDNNNGKSLKEAFKTVAKAASVVKEGETVSILGGVYREGGIRLAARENKSGGYITFKNYNHENVVIKGSMLVSGWEHYQNNIWKLPSKENDTSDLNRGIHYQQVFYGEGLDLQKIGYPHYATYEGNLVWKNKGYYVPIKENSNNPFGMSEGTFYVEELEGGEFDLYVWLPDGRTPNDEGITMEVSDKPYLINTSNVDNVKIQGITFMHTAAAAMGNSGNSYQGGYALRVGINAIVDNCTFAYTDFVGLNLSRGSNKEVNQHQIVRNCKVHHNGAVGISASSKDFLIEKSEFYENASRAFYQLWHTGAIKCNNHGWGEVKDNYIHDEYSHGVWYDTSFSEAFDDSHPIVIHHNYINGIGKDHNPLGLRELPYRGHGIFVEYSSNAKIYNNIIADSRQRGIYLASSWDTVVTNNLIIGSKLQQLTFNARSRTEQQHDITNNIIQNNILYNKSLNAQEDIKLIATDEGQDISNKLEQNMIYNENGAAYSYDFERTHWSIEDNIEDVDPKFNKKGLDYSSWSLLQESPAIDVSTVNYDFVNTDYSYGIRDDLIDVGCFEFK